MNRKYDYFKHIKEGSRRYKILAMLVPVIIVAVFVSLWGFWLKDVKLHFSYDNSISYSELWEKKQYKELILYGNSVLAKNPMDKTALVFTGFANFYEGISILSKEERSLHMEQAVFLLRKTLLTEGKVNSSVKYILGKAYYHKGHYYSNLAVKYLTEALAENYAGKDVYEYLGLAYSELGDNKLAISNFEKALENGSSDLFLLTLAQAYLNSGNLEKAVEYLSATENTTDNMVMREKSLILLVEVYLNQQKYDKASECCSKVLKINPNSADAYYYSGEIYAARGDRTKAVSQWRKAYRLNPDHYKTKLRLFG